MAVKSLDQMKAVYEGNFWQMGMKYGEERPAFF